MPPDMLRRIEISSAAHERRVPRSSLGSYVSETPNPYEQVGNLPLAHNSLSFCNSLPSSCILPIALFMDSNVNMVVMAAGIARIMFVPMPL